MLQPLVTDALIDKLKAVFPDAPGRSMSHREIDHWIGQQEVLNYLRKLHEEQEIEAF
ncbi:MAG: hypothetical protein VKI63_04425 [Cyanobium sp.]|nr:hypothetical protein [Cyanobium sp.]